MFLPGKERLFGVGMPLWRNPGAPAGNFFFCSFDSPFLCRLTRQEDGGGGS